tara:strand:+ start:1172 stop:1714 length:543 start_codon:yes stop_codon:yes gene_type:complete
MNDFRRIVLTGAPGTGKSSTVNALANLGYSIMPEVSREYWDQTGYGSGGTDPWRNLISFSKAIWKLRVNQYIEAKNLSGAIFYDRSVIDVLAYIDAGNKDINEAMNAKLYPYDKKVFIFPPWEDIYSQDDGRWEPFSTCQLVHDSVMKTYTSLGYNMIEVPRCSIEDRAKFIIDLVDGDK